MTSLTRTSTTPRREPSSIRTLKSTLNQIAICYYVIFAGSVEPDDAIDEVLQLARRFYFPSRDFESLVRSTMALSTWISDVTNATLNITLSTFSFQDALNPSGKDTPNAYYNPPFLFHSGCLQPDGTQNCTASCQDPNDIFGSLDTLHNCMVYPTVADLYAKSNLSNTSVPDYYKIQKSQKGSELYINITTTIKACLTDYCNVTLAGSGCIEGLDAWDSSYSPSNITSTFYIYNDYEGYNNFDFCQYVPKSLNQDIGGIGV